MESGPRSMTLADDVRGHEVHPAGPLGESLADALQASPEARTEPDDELAILRGADDRPGH
jgi:hypothetical protein